MPLECPETREGSPDYLSRPVRVPHEGVREHDRVPGVGQVAVEDTVPVGHGYSGVDHPQGYFEPEDAICNGGRPAYLFMYSLCQGRKPGPE